jgi:RES domain-containing protein
MAFDAARVASAPRASFAGVAFRHQAPGFDPRSGAGARIRGGRYNPPESFPALYLCTTRDCAVAELSRLGERQSIGVAGLFPRVLYRYEVALSNIIDLTDLSVTEHLGIARPELTAEWHVTQLLGETAHALVIQALLAPSATGVDNVIVIFPEHLGLGRVEPEQVERWESPADL